MLLMGNIATAATTVTPIMITATMISTSVTPRLLRLILRALPPPAGCGIAAYDRLGSSRSNTHRTFARQGACASAERCIGRPRIGLESRPTEKPVAGHPPEPLLAPESG